MPATGDRHKLALLLGGRKMHRAEIDGAGAVTATLPGAARFSGPAGIKVKCRSRNRFYVIVDGQETGLLCPTERIGVELGEHTVDIYDPVSDSTTTHKLNVADTHNSARVKLDE